MPILGVVLVLGEEGTQVPVCVGGAGGGFGNELRRQSRPELWPSLSSLRLVRLSSKMSETRVI